jgi:hypothetical protein
MNHSKIGRKYLIKTIKVDYSSINHLIVIFIQGQDPGEVYFSIPTPKVDAQTSICLHPLDRPSFSPNKPKPPP